MAILIGSVVVSVLAALGMTLYARHIARKG